MAQVKHQDVPLRTVPETLKADTSAAPKRKRRLIPPNESKSDKFRRLASGRVTVALHSLDGIAGLAGPSYESTNEQRNKIIAALRAGMDKIERVFGGEVVAKKDMFEI